MKNTFFNRRRTSILTGAALACLLAMTAWAANILIYDGTGTLRMDIALAGANNQNGSVVPGSASGNTVTVDYSVGTKPEPYRVFGGLSDSLAVTENEV